MMRPRQIGLVLTVGALISGVLKITMASPGPAELSESDVALLSNSEGEIVLTEIASPATEPLGDVVTRSLMMISKAKELPVPGETERASQQIHKATHADFRFPERVIKFTSIIVAADLTRHAELNPRDRPISATGVIELLRLTRHGLAAIKAIDTSYVRQGNREFRNLIESKQIPLYKWDDYYSALPRNQRDYLLSKNRDSKLKTKRAYFYRNICGGKNPLKVKSTKDGIYGACLWELPKTVGMFHASIVARVKFGAQIVSIFSKYGALTGGESSALVHRLVAQAKNEILQKTTRR